MLLTDKIMTKELREYLKNEWKFNNHKKYLKYFEEWIDNITDNQIYYFRKDMIKAQRQ